ncbi:hypothetical protein [Loktanella sp. S4079]|uniref:hypothetical protein n=1 Tax=Loktanella sp. S4079 TaxID=579483 RepID=UPI0005F9AB1C|nr:hypothetical protein [Loktanella sp. S4079]KJZ20729.1 hypothetical protein TW80_08185 [Loktanella sp. S4079]
MKTSKFTRAGALILIAGALTACEASRKDGTTVDGGLDGGPLPDGVASIWVDPDGCQHWYVDDGIEGYMSPRLHRDGTPYCREERGMITLKDGSTMLAEPEPTR